MAFAHFRPFFVCIRNLCNFIYIMPIIAFFLVLLFKEISLLTRTLQSTPLQNPGGHREHGEQRTNRGQKLSCLILEVLQRLASVLYSTHIIFLHMLVCA